MTNDNYITVRRPDNVDALGTGGLPTNEDEYGNLTVSSFNTVATFWADIEEIAPTSDDFGVGGTIRFNRRLRITADSRDTEALDLDDIVTYDDNDSEFFITSLSESDWKWQREIIIELSNR